MAKLQDIVPTAPTAGVTTTSVNTTSTGAIPTGVGEVRGRSICVACNRAFDILFSDDGTPNIPNPTNTQIFPTGVYVFELSPKNTHFKVTAASAGSLKSWICTRV